ncbi:metalloregulator ArsR/SmtB family transcription factor [Candidatus Woesearchaeota archaeon]|nr:metalloregulator ArsR/SmtB family transcription factor [Candidatus Woesearchaeota archaeon]
MKQGSIPYHLCLEVLGNPLRISIIQLLKAKPRSVSELSGQLGEEQSKVSHSLAALKKCNFVESRREGKKLIYSLKETFLKKIKSENLFEAIEKHYKKQGCQCWRCGE